MYPLAGSSNLLVVGERGLVAMVAVGDQEPAVGERVARSTSSSRRQSRAPSTSSSGGPSGTVERGLSLVQEEDRLELRLRRAQEPQPPLLRAAVRPLVRQDGSVLVRLDPSDTTRPVRVRATPSGPT